LNLDGVEIKMWELLD